MRCTTTAIAGSSSIARLARYASTRSAHSDIQQRTIASMSASSPTMLVKVSFMPANDEPAVSSIVADERTATLTPIAEPVIGVEHGLAQRRREAGFVHQAAPGARRRRQRMRRVGIDAAGEVAQRLAGAARLHRGQIRRRGDDEAGRNRQTGAHELAEVRALAAGNRDVAARQLVEPGDRARRTRHLAHRWQRRRRLRLEAHRTVRLGSTRARLRGPRFFSVQRCARGLGAMAPRPSSSSRSLVVTMPTSLPLSTIGRHPM